MILASTSLSLQASKGRIWDPMPSKPQTESGELKEQLILGALNKFLWCHQLVSYYNGVSLRKIIFKWQVKLFLFFSFS